MVQQSLQRNKEDILFENTLKQSFDIIAKLCYYRSSTTGSVVFFRLRDRHRNGQTLVYSLANLEVLSSRQKRRLLSSSVGQIEPYLATPSTRTLDFRDKFLSFATDFF